MIRRAVAAAIIPFLFAATHQPAANNDRPANSPWPAGHHSAIQLNSVPTVPAIADYVAPDPAPSVSGVAKIRQLRARIRRQRAVIERLQAEVQAPTLAQQDIEWIGGYLEAGGDELAAMLEHVLPCESGGAPDPHSAVSPTNDVGRAQINRAVWAPKVAELWPDLSFTEAMTDPGRNGWMAGHVERDAVRNGWHPLQPWVCARIAGIVR